MNTLIPFTYEDQPVRTLAIDGEPWFVLSDLCKVLGLTQPHRVAARLVDDMKGRTPITTLGGDQDMTIVSEAGMYEVVIRSDKPEAATFRRWITTEVLPSIRKTGSYRVNEFDAQIPKTLPAALHAYAREIEAREAMEAYARELEPKADSYDRFMSGDGTYSVGSVAKMLGLSQNKLFEQLRNTHVLIAKGAMRNTPYQHYMHHFEVKASDFSRSDGTRGNSYTTRVQPSGIAFIARKLGLPTPRVEVTAA